MKSHLFFDLDGTLIDSCEGIYYSYSTACNLLSLSSPSINSFRSKIGPPIIDIFFHFNPLAKAVDADRFKILFRSIYNEEGYKMSSCYEGVTCQLLALSKCKHLTLSVVTNKPTQPSVSILKRLSMFSLFREVVGSDYLHYHQIGDHFQNKSQAIEYLMTKYTVEKSHLIYVGDTVADSRSAQSVGTQFIAAKYGYHVWNDSELIGITSINSSLDLLPTIENLLEKKYNA